MRGRDRDGVRAADGVAAVKGVAIRDRRRQRAAVGVAVACADRVREGTVSAQQQRPGRPSPTEPDRSFAINVVICSMSDKFVRQKVTVQEVCSPLGQAEEDR